MRLRRSVLCILLIILLIPAAVRLKGRLPMDAQPLIEKKYGGWAGTLRLWVLEGWTPGAGSAAGWLNKCASRFEKAHRGVYVQPEYVEASALRDLGGDGILPPDMVLFPPGALDGPAMLLPLEAPEALREPLRRAGNAGGVCHAVPVMLGGYLWAYNPDRLSGIPGSWREAAVTPLSPGDEPYRHWSAALLALCASRRAVESPDAPQADGLDLGLPPDAAAPTPSPAPASEAPPCLLPEGFQFSESAWRDFANGDAAAVVVTQREIVRLKALDERGGAPAWRLSAAGRSFTDQALYIAIVRREPDDGRASLCREFIDHLLSDPCQSELARAGAFAVTDAPSGYAPGDPLSIMDSALRAADLAAAPALDPRWPDRARPIVQAFIEGGGDPAGLWPDLSACLREKSEH